MIRVPLMSNPPYFAARKLGSGFDNLLLPLLASWTGRRRGGQHDAHSRGLPDLAGGAAAQGPQPVQSDQRILQLSWPRSDRNPTRALRNRTLGSTTSTVIASIAFLLRASASSAAPRRTLRSGIVLPLAAAFLARGRVALDRCLSVREQPLHLRNQVPVHRPLGHISAGPGGCGIGLVFGVLMDGEHGHLGLRGEGPDPPCGFDAVDAWQADVH